MATTLQVILRTGDDEATSSEDTIRIVRKDAAPEFVDPEFSPTMANVDQSITLSGHNFN